MKLNWFGPVPPAQTAIADVTRRAAAALRERFDLTIWTDVDGFDPLLAGNVPVRSCRQPEELWPDANFADFSLYHIGNDARFHATYAELAERHPGVVVFHDFNLLELHRERFLAQENGQELFERYVFFHEGAAALEAVREHREGRLSFEEMVERVPLVRHTAAAANGVVSFNPAMVPVLRKMTRAPVLGCPLPVGPEAEIPPAPERKFDGGPVELVMFGYLNSPNRRLGEVLAALQPYGAEQVRLTLFGHIEHHTSFEETLRKYDLHDRVVFRGFLPEAEMEEVLRSAHLAVNLRNPTRGESSDALLQAWKHALPMLVTDTGYYATVPAETVFKAQPGEEVAAVRHAVDTFGRNPEVGFATGRAGHAYLRHHHSAEAFAENLFHFLEEAEAYRLRRFAPSFARRMGAFAREDFPEATIRRHLRERLSTEIGRWTQE